MDPFGYVILVAILSVILLIYLSIRVGMKRKHFDIPLPDQYTTDPSKKLFNCYQRAYMNMNENMATFLVMLFMAGDAFPRVAAVAGLIWIAGRYVYALGYWTGDPAKREYGQFALVALLVLLVCAVINALDRLGLVDVI